MNTDTNNRNIPAGAGTATDRQTMTSIEIAEVTGKQHKDVLKAIRKMEPAWEKVTERKFALCMRISELANGVKKQNPYYLLTKEQCLYVATKFNDEARARLVIRWEQLEQERLAAHQPFPSVTPPPGPGRAPALFAPRPYSRRELLLMQIELEDENERLRRDLRRKDEGLWELTCEMVAYYRDLASLRQSVGLPGPRPYVHCAGPAPSLPAPRTYTATQIGRDYGLSAASLNTILRDAGVQYLSGGQWIPAPDYAGRGFTAVRHVRVTDDGGQPVEKPYTVWTEAGRRFIADTLALQGVTPTAPRTLPPSGERHGTEEGQ